MASQLDRTPEYVAAKAGELLMRLGLAVLMIVLPVAAIYSRRLVFTLMPVAAGLIFIGATLTPGNSVTSDLKKALATPAVLAGFALIIWIAMSLVWTPLPKLAIEQFAKSIGTIALTFAVIAALPGRSRTSNLNLMPIGAGFAAVAAATLVLAVPASIPASVDLELSTLERASVGLVMLVWPALAALGVRQRWSLGGALAVAVTIAAVAVWTPAALAGMAAGALVFSLSTSNARRMSRILAVFFAVLILAAPLLVIVAERLLAVIPELPHGMPEPVIAWADLIRDAPGRLLTGYGYNTLSRALSSGFLTPVTPVNLAFEIWFELGLLGAAGAATVLAASFLAAGRTESHGAPFLLAGLCCALVIAFWGLATLQLWWVTLLGATAISFSCVLKGQVRDGRPPSMGLFTSGTPPAA